MSNVRIQRKKKKTHTALLQDSKEKQRHFTRKLKMQLFRPMFTKVSPKSMQKPPLVRCTEVHFCGPLAFKTIIQAKYPFMGK